MKKFSSTAKLSSRSDGPNKFALLLVGVVFCVVVAWLFPQFAGTVAGLLLSPVMLVREWFAPAPDDLPAGWMSRTELVREVEQYQQHQASSSEQVASITRLRDENTRLRNLLNANNENRILSRVTARPTTLPYDKVVIDSGAREGVVVGAPVYAGREQVIGVVQAVYPSSAVVTLVTSPGFAASAYVIGPDIYTTAEGVGGGVLRLSVPPDVPIEVGNIVVLPAVDAGLFGVITRIESAPTQPEQYGYVSPPIPLQSLYYVTVGDESITTNTVEQAEAAREALELSPFVMNIPEALLITPATATSSATTSSATSTSATSTTRSRALIESNTAASDTALELDE